MMTKLMLAAGWVGICLTAMGGEGTSPQRYRLYIGVYTDAQNRGIQRVEFDASAGTLETFGVVGETLNPSFLALHPLRPILYAANEVWGPGSGSVSAFEIRADGSLRMISTQPSGGKGPCHLVAEASGRALLVANYGDGVFASLPMAEDGTLRPVGVTHRRSELGPRKDRQESPHAHGIYVDPENRHALAVDLGTDEIVTFALDPATGQLVAPPSSVAKTAAGAGPRHLAISPDGRFVYVTNELANTVTAFERDRESSRLREVQSISTLPEGYASATTTAEIAVHPNGKTLYVSNRGHDSIAVFRIDAASGKLLSLGFTSTGGKSPRHFAMDPAGRWLIAANQQSDNLVLFKIHDDGTLEATGVQAAVHAPVCVLFCPAK